jgi:sugar lactone lactonase YvrE
VPRLRPASTVLRSLVALLLTAVVLALAPAGTATARPFEGRLRLPAGFQPEGIAAGPGTSLFAGSLADGRVLRLDPRTGRRSTLVAGEEGAVAVGLEYDPARQRLWVAGGPTGEVRAYDARSGDLLATYTVPGEVFLNDLAVTRDAVYVTDSRSQELVVVPTPRRGPDGGDLPGGPAERLTLTGDFEAVLPTDPDQPVFNLNGIVAARGGRSLLAVQSATGHLFEIDPRDGTTTRVPIEDEDGEADYPLTNGDGLLLRGRTLYAVQNRLDTVAEIRLDSDLEEGRVRDLLTDPTLDVPTTVALVAGRLYAVNARFGVEDPGTAAYDIRRVPRR